jgi:hypothetical protein
VEFGDSDPKDPDPIQILFFRIGSKIRKSRSLKKGIRNNTRNEMKERKKERKKEIDLFFFGSLALDLALALDLRSNFQKQKRGISKVKVN